MTRQSLWITAYVLCLAGFFVGNAAFTVWQINVSQHRWCQTLDLITERKPPPGATASIRFYDVFVQQKNAFGCN